MGRGLEVLVWGGVSFLILKFCDDFFIRRGVGARAWGEGEGVLRS